jgi:hypothetical protein
MENLAKLEKVLKKVPESLSEKEKVFFELWANFLLLVFYILSFM